MLASFKKCYRTRLGNFGLTSVEEQTCLEGIVALLETEIKSEWGLSRKDWVEFVEDDPKKGGKTIHSVTRLAEVPPVGEVTVEGVLRSDDQAMLHEEHNK